jgi:5-(hydroxymethyl)furfural/furfural oxidase
LAFHSRKYGLADVPGKTNDAALDQWLLANCEEYGHAAGTCRMGSPDDPAGVVDQACRVLGVGGLRVADASVLPRLPSAAPQLTIVMLAERVAELLRST